MLKMMKISHKTTYRQQGAAAVEFAIVAMLLFTLLFGIIEFGRLFYLYNTVQEVTRRAAREAVVNFTSDKPGVQRKAVFQANTTGVVKLAGGGEVTNMKVVIRYLHGVWDADSEEWVYTTASPATPSENISECLNNTSECINYVEAKVCEADSNDECTSPVSYVPMIGLFTFLSVPIPASTVIMPAESLGYRNN